jgi:hypothetical protein
MISWTISVEPVTSSTASTNVYSSGGLFLQHYNEVALGVPAISVALGVRRNESTFRTARWSETIQNESGVDATVNATTIRGTTNSTSTVGTFDGNAQTGSTNRTVTLLGTVASQTSTTTTAQRTSTGTSTTTQNYVVYTTTNPSASSDIVTTATMTATRTAHRTTSATHSLEIDATTTTGSHLDNVAAATVYQANTRHATDANVIWVADQSLIEDDIATGAAIEAATSTTRTTLYPDTQTMTYSVVAKSATSEIDHTNVSSTQNLAFVSGQNTTTETTYVTSEFAIPQLTSNGQTETQRTTASNRTTSVFTSNVFGAAFTKTATQLGTSLFKVGNTFYGLQCDRTYTWQTSRTIKAEDNAWVTSGSTTTSAAAPTSTWTTSSALSDTQVVVGNPISQSTQEVRGITTMLMLHGQATTVSGGSVSRVVEIKTGVRTPQNSVAGFYAANGLDETLFVDDAYAFASRGVSTANPVSFAIFSSYGDSEYPDFDQIGSASFSGLNGTATTTTSSGSETSSSFTFALQPQGNGRVEQTNSTRNLAAFIGTLGTFETLLVTIPRGVYRKSNGDTVSHSEQVVSYTSGSGVEWLEPVTYFRSTADQSKTAILWTAPRNSTALP